MKLFAYAVALAGLAAAAPMNAQILSSRIPTSSRGSNDGQWYSVGRDNNGNTIYERQTYDSNGNTVVQRGRRNSNGTFTILSSQTVANNGNNRNNRNNDCNNSNSVGSIVFGQSRNTNCDYRNGSSNRNDGGWYPVNNGGNGGNIYERRTRDSNGNTIVQRARRNSNGSFSIISTRNVGNGNGDWNNGNNGNNGRGNRDEDNQWRKDQNQQNKDWKKSHKGNKHDRDD